MNSALQSPDTKVGRHQYVVAENDTISLFSSKDRAQCFCRRMGYNPESIVSLVPNETYLDTATAAIKSIPTDLKKGLKMYHIVKGCGTFQKVDFAPSQSRKIVEDCKAAEELPIWLNIRNASGLVTERGIGSLLERLERNQLLGRIHVLDVRDTCICENACFLDMIPLLMRRSFQFLDIHHTFASTRDSMKNLHELIKRKCPDHEEDEIMDIFAKVIWLPKAYAPFAQLHPACAAAHKRYYDLVDQQEIEGD